MRATTATYRGRWVCGASATHTEKTFDVYTSPLAINGDQGQIVTLVDATEAAGCRTWFTSFESLAAVGQATAQVAHEIRNPLGSIRLGVSMLRDGITDAEALNTIELVERGIRHLNKLVVDVTQFSRQKALERSESTYRSCLMLAWISFPRACARSKRLWGKSAQKPSWETGTAISCGKFCKSDFQRHR